MLIIIISFIITFFVHRNLTNWLSHWILTRKYLSLLHNLITSIACITFYNTNYYDSFSSKDLIMIGIHLGYYLSDGIYSLRTKKYEYVLHHILSIYFVLLNYYFGAAGIFVFSMFIAELSGFFLNLRTIIIKTFNIMCSTLYTFCNRTNPVFIIHQTI